MAEKLYTKPSKKPCPRCKNSVVRIGIYHLGTKWVAECSECGFGEVAGCSEEQAMARCHGNYLEAINNDTYTVDDPQQTISPSLSPRPFN